MSFKLNQLTSFTKYCIFILLLQIVFITIHAQPKKDSRTAFFPTLEERPNQMPDKKHVWVFVLAGQSNMAGRAQVEAEDTIPNQRILTINKSGEVILAKEPLHFYEPTMAGLDCGMSFANALLKDVPADVSILLIPTAVGGSSIIKWINDSIHRSVPLFSNFKEKVKFAKEYGQIKGILWHQGEADANEMYLPVYFDQMTRLFSIFRKTCGDKKLPIILGELGSFSLTAGKQFTQINDIMHRYVAGDPRSAVVGTSQFGHRGDNLHFNSEGQRSLGKGYAKAFSEIFLHKD
jgi:hypothetical protein